MASTLPDGQTVTPTLDMDDYDGFCVDDLVSVQCVSIDTTHRALLTGFRECRWTLGSGSAAELDAACRQLRILVAEVAKHCATEELLLRAASYAHLEQHRRAHEALCTYLDQVAAQLERGETPEGAESLLEQAFTRLLMHFNTTDTLYVGYLSEKSVSPTSSPDGST